MIAQTEHPHTVRKVIDFPFLAAGIAIPFLFLGLIVLEKEYHLVERLLSHLSIRYGMEFLVSYGDLLVLSLPFAGLLLAVISRMILGRGDGAMNHIAMASLWINLILTVLYAVTLSGIFLSAL